MKISDIKIEILVILTGAFLGFILIWPVPFIGLDKTWGAQWDLYNNFWFFHYVKKCISNWDFNFLTQEIFYPFGYNLRVDLAHFFIPLISVPLQLIFPIHIAYNILLILILTFNYWAFYKLAFKLTGGMRIISVSASVAWTANPLVLADMYMGSIELMACGFIPLTLLSFISLWQKFSWRNFFQATGSLFLTCITNWLFGAYTLISLVLIVPSYKKLKPLMLWITASIVTFIIASPLIINIVQDNTVFPNLENLLEKMTQYQLDFGRMVYSGEINFLKLDPKAFDKLQAITIIDDSIDLPEVIHKKAYDIPNFAFPRLPLLLFGILGTLYSIYLRIKTKNSKKKMESDELPTISEVKWVNLCIVSFILSLGPYLQYSPYLGLYFHRLPLPYYYLYSYLPFFSICYRPHRFIILMILSLSVLATMGFARFIRQIRGGSWISRLNSSCIISLIIIITIVVELIFARRYNAQKPVLIRIPKYYYELARDPDDFAILEVPFSPVPVSNQNAIYGFFQSIHNKKTFNMTLLLPWQWKEIANWARNNKLFYYLLQSQNYIQECTFFISKEDKDEIINLGFRYLVVHTIHYNENSNVGGKNIFGNDLFYFLSQICSPPEEREDGILVYDLRTMSPGDSQVKMPCINNLLKSIEFQVTLSTNDSVKNNNALLKIQTPYPYSSRKITFWIRSNKPMEQPLEIQFKWRNSVEITKILLETGVTLQRIEVPNLFDIKEKDYIELEIAISSGKLDATLDNFEWFYDSDYSKN